jgi:hypothetical protein
MPPPPLAMPLPLLATPLLPPVRPCRKPPSNLALLQRQLMGWAGSGWGPPSRLE